MITNQQPGTPAARAVRQPCDRELRAPLAGRLAYFDPAGWPGEAAWCDVSRVGARVSLGRYLRPGSTVRLAVAHGGDAIELPARVMWCRPRAGSTAFHAGLRVQRPSAEAALAFAQLVYDAQSAAATVCTASFVPRSEPADWAVPDWVSA